MRGMVGAVVFVGALHAFTGAANNQYAPSNVVFMILGGSCPSGYEETPALNGSMVRGTIAANGNVGTTGGSDTFTPTGTLAAISAGTPAGINATSTVTPLGTINTPTLSWPAGVPTYTGTVNTLAVTAHTVVATKQGTAAGNVVTTATHAITGVPGGTVAWPAGVPTSNALTFTGSSSTVGAQTFTGSALGTHTHVFTGQAATAQPAFTHVIFCHKSAP